MTLTQKFCFKLINALLDIIGVPLVACNQCGSIDYASKAKATFNPVSAYDNVIEISIRDALRLLAPAADVYGEECGYNARGAPTTWFVDPIDGTKAFISGSPVWGTILGVLEHNNIAMGGVNHFMLSERIVAVNGITYYRGANASFRRLPLQPRCSKPVAQCVIATSSIDAMTAAERAKFNTLARCARHVVYNYDCYAYTLLMKGYVDAVVECHFKPYDFIGLLPALKGIGCCVCNWRGREVCCADKVLVSRSAGVQANVLALIGGD
ncbi:MAG: inositol monophosphatase family protein [Candidatus Hodgkinia cicadicola]